MQLASFDDNAIIRPGFLHAEAARLIRSIDDPSINGHAFEIHLADNQRNFPQLFSAYYVKKTALVKRSGEERLGLKLKLLDDVRVINAKIQEQIDAEKKIDDKILPSDPDECKKCMEEMEDDLLETIAECKRTITRIHAGAYSVEKLIQGKKDLEAFDESPYTEDVKPAKKPRTG